jgi:transposase
MLPPEIQSEILSSYFGKKMGIRAIARTLSVDRKSVKAVILRRGVLLEKRAGIRSSILDPFKTKIEELMRLEPGVPAKVVFQRIREEGYWGSYPTVTNWVKSKRAIPYRAREAFLSLEFQSGQCAQVDWGEFGDVFGDGIKIHCFIMVLCFSRLLYLEFTRSEKFEDFIRCHENAFKFLGGVPLECWYDNLTSAVTDRIGSLLRFNSRFMAYMGHHAIRPHACNPARGNEKGRVEDAVKFIRSNFWPARKFSSFEDLCSQASQWRDEYANKREHAKTKRIPIILFESEEKKTLRKLNPNSYDCDEVFSRVVPPQFHILYEANRYSVPWTLVGMTVTLRVNSDEIKVFYNERFITCHKRSFKKNEIITQPKHSQGLLDRKPGQNRDNWQISAVKGLGTHMASYLDLLRSGARSLRNEASKILALATVYGEAEVNDAARELLKLAIVGVENMELILKNKTRLTETAPHPLQFQDSKLNRFVPSVDLRRYDTLLFENHKPKKEGDNNNGTES